MDTEKNELQNISERVRQKIRDIPDFPKPGIIFKDITPVLADVTTFQSVIDAWAKRYCDHKIDKVVGVESRGFIFGAPLAYRLDVGFVPIRKKGKLPYKTVTQTYDLEYGTDTVEVHEDGLTPGDHVLVVDDLLATGGTCAATCELVEKVGGKIVECVFMVELDFLKGREKLKNREIFSLVHY